MWENSIFNYITIFFLKKDNILSYEWMWKFFLRWNTKKKTFKEKLYDKILSNSLSSKHKLFSLVKTRIDKCINFNLYTINLVCLILSRNYSVSTLSRKFVIDICTVKCTLNESQIFVKSGIIHTYINIFCD